jgi:DNA-binding CsgD family transcriptional regulator
MGGEAVALTRAVAVLGAPAEVMLAARLADLEPAVAELTADRLAASQILAPARPLDFFHPLIGASILEDIAPGARRVAHRRAAELLDGQGSLARVAAHLLECGPAEDGWVVERLRDAASEAFARGAPTSAASYLERALAETSSQPVRTALLLGLGEAQLHAGLAGAAQRFREALDLSTDRRMRAEICLALGRALFSTGDYAIAREAFRGGLSELADGDDDLSLELRAWYMTLGGNDLPAVAGERLTALIEDAAPGRTRTERVLLAHLAYQGARSGTTPRDEIAGLARRALADGRLLEDSATEAGPYGAACQSLAFAGEPDAAISELSRAIGLIQHRGSPVAFGRLSLLRGLAYFMRGELWQAMADFESASDAYDKGYELGLPATAAFTALCLIERDDLAAAERALVLPGGQERWQAQPSFISYLYAVGRLRATQGELREGLDTLLESEQLVRMMNLPNPAVNLPWRSEAALLAERLGEHDDAVELVAEDLRLARLFGAPHALGISLRAGGLINGGASGLKQLAEAVALLDSSGIRLELARARSDYGAELRRAGRRVQARTELERALDLAHHCGARRIANQARAELIAAGAKPRRDAITGRDALTASELRVARLAAEGLTNREIAQALFITTKTAKAHLRSVYRKLEITRRDQLADALTGLLGDGREDPGATAAIIS